MNVALAIVLWAIVPILMGMIGAFFRDSREVAEFYLDTNPFVHIAVVLEATVGGELSRFGWFSHIGGNSLTVEESMIWIFACTLGYILLGGLFAWRAKCRFRRHIFK